MMILLSQITNHIILLQHVQRSGGLFLYYQWHNYRDLTKWLPLYKWKIKILQYSHTIYRAGITLIGAFNTTEPPLFLYDACSLQEKFLASYDVTLGDRINSDGDECTQKQADANDHLSTTNTPEFLPPSKPCRIFQCNKCERGQGLTALVSD